MLPIGDTAMQAIEYALDALNARAEVTSQNVSNAEVPGYKASRLRFEDQLAKALESGNVGRLDPAAAERAYGLLSDANGNTVNIEEEVVEMMKTNLLQGAMVEAFNFKTNLLRTAIRGQ